MEVIGVFQRVLQDIMGMDNEQIINISGILFSTESGAGSFIKNDEVKDKSLFLNLTYRVRAVLFDGSELISEVKHLRHIEELNQQIGRSATGNCLKKDCSSPIEQEPVSFKATGNVEYIPLECCTLVCMEYKSLVAGGNCVTPCVANTIDCTKQFSSTSDCTHEDASGVCEYDPCCLHAGCQYANCSCYPWTSCQQAVIRWFLKDKNSFVNSITITGNDFGCVKGSSSTFQALGYNDYQWSVTGGTIIGSSTNPTVTIQWNSPGIQRVEVLTNLTSNCPNLGLLNVTVPGIVISSDKITVCSGEKFKLVVEEFIPNDINVYSSDWRKDETIITGTHDNYYYETSIINNTSIEQTYTFDLKSTVKNDNATLSCTVISNPITVTVKPASDPECCNENPANWHYADVIFYSGNSVGLRKINETKYATKSMADFLATASVIKIQNSMVINTGISVALPVKTFEFGLEAKVIVNNNASLTMNGTTFKGSKCGMWQGVEVNGDGSNTLANLGKLVMRQVTGTKARTIIQDAITAVKCINGGYINAENANFYNNYFGIDIQSYAGANRNKVSYSTFLTTSTDGKLKLYPKRDLEPEAFINITSVAGVDLGSPGRNFFMKGTTGVSGMDAPNLDVSNNTFSNLSVAGISLDYTLNAAYTGSHISTNQFTNVRAGIILHGGVGAQILDNSFSNTTLYGDGIIINGCQAFSVKGGDMTASGVTGGNTFNNVFAGVFVINTNIDNIDAPTFNSVISKNQFTLVETGVQTAGRNMRLQILCNDFINYSFRGWFITSGGTQPFLSDQGQCPTQITLPKIPAGNLFRLNKSLDISSTPAFKYYHNPGVASDSWVPGVNINVTLESCGTKDVETTCKQVARFNGLSIAELKKRIIETPGGIERGLLLSELLRLLVAKPADCNSDECDPLLFLRGLNTIDAKQILVPSLIRERMFSDAREIMNGMPDATPEDREFLNYHRTMVEIGEQGRTIHNLTAQEEQIIREVAAGCSPTSANAQAVLSMVYGEKIPVDKELSVNCGGGSAKHEKSDDEALMVNTSKVPYMSEPVPNPVTASSVISYFVPKDAANAIINIFDVTGRKIKTFVLNKGVHASISIFNADMPNGIYFCLMTINGKTESKSKLIVIK